MWLVRNCLQWKLLSGTVVIVTSICIQIFEGKTRTLSYFKSMEKAIILI